MQYYIMAFIPAEEGGYAILSPDFKEIASQGEDLPKCMHMAQDALNTVAADYARTRRSLPEPCSLPEARERIRKELESLSVPVPEDILFPLVPVPAADLSLVKISATFTRHTLDIIDSKAKAHGMTRSGFLAAAALAYV